MREIIKKYGHAWTLAYGAVYLPWFIHLERTVDGNYAIMHTALDDRIPFVEYFVIPYLLWFPYIAAVLLYLFFRDKQDYYRLCKFLFSGMTIFLLICTFFPNGTDLRVPVNPERNLCSRLVHLVHLADTSTNVFPSIHVFNSIGVHCAVANNEVLGRLRWLRRGSLLLMVLICFSTVFLKQHSVVDGIGAIIMAHVIYHKVYGVAAASRRKPQHRKALG